MKQRIRFVDNITKKGRSVPGGAVTVIEKETRNLDHFQAQLKNKSQVFVNRKKRAKNGYKKHKSSEDQLGNIYLLLMNSVIQYTCK